MRFIIMATLLALSACSAPTAEPTVATASKTTEAPAVKRTEKSEREVQTEKGIQWARCMTEHGVDTPDDAFDGPQFRRPGQSAEVQAAADKACRKFYPEKTWRKLDPEEAERQRVYAACMSDEGVPVPRPDANDELAEEVRWDSPGREFMRAHVACRSHLMTAESAGDPLPQDDPGR